jgi:biotin carboxylase
LPELLHAVSDALSEHLGLLSNGTHIPQRRDKKIQQELVKAAGLRSVRQAGGKTVGDVEEFLHTEPYPIVVKPVESAGSDGVKLCHTYEEATQHFDLLMHSQRKVGHRDGAAVLCQEFLRGTEYVVDTVSRDGIHKVVSECINSFSCKAIE